MKKVTWLVVMVTVVAFASVALAQAPAKPAAPAPAPAKPAATAAPAPAPAKVEKFSGTIDKVDEMAKAIVVKSKKEEKAFAVDDKTKISKGKDTISFADLKKGMSVSVEYTKAGDKMTAVSIKAAAPKAAPKEKKG